MPKRKLVRPDIRRNIEARDVKHFIDIGRMSGRLPATVKLYRISDSHKFTGQLAKAVHLWAALYLFIGCSLITIIDNIVRAAYGTTDFSIFIEEMHQ